MICLEGIIEFLRKLRQDVKEDGGSYDGPVYLDGRKRSLRWGDEHRDKTVDEGIRNKIILARYCKHNIAADISAEMDAVVRQLQGLRAGWKNLHPLLAPLPVRMAACDPIGLFLVRRTVSPFFDEQGVRAIPQRGQIAPIQ